jgi:hypothetical protein
LATVVVEKVATLVQQCHSRPPPPTNKKQRRIENEQMQRELKRTMSSMTGHALGSVQEPVLICIRRQNKFKKGVAALFLARDKIHRRRKMCNVKRE